MRWTLGISVGGCVALLIWCIAIPELLGRTASSDTVKTFTAESGHTASRVGPLVESADVVSARIRLLSILWGDREPETVSTWTGIDPRAVAQACIGIMDEAGPADRRSVLALETLSFLGVGAAAVQSELLVFSGRDEWKGHARRILRALLAPHNSESTAASIALIREEWRKFLSAWTWGRHTTCIELLRELSDHRVAGAADLFMELTAEVSSKADSEAPEFAIPDAGPDNHGSVDEGAPILRSTLQGALARELVRCTALLNTEEAASRLRIAFGESPNFLAPVGLASAIICLQQRPDGPLAEMLRPMVLNAIRPGGRVHEYVRITALTVAGLYGESAVQSLRESIMLSKDASTFVAAVGGLAEATFRSKSQFGVAFLRELVSGPLAPDTRTDPAGEVRRDVYRALYHAGDSNDRARLLKRLETSKDAVEEWAILVASEYNEPPTAQFIEKMRHRSVHRQRGSSHETRLRAKLVEIVARTADDKTTALTPYLRDSDPGVSERARRELVRIAVEKYSKANDRLEWLRSELTAPLPLSHRRILLEAAAAAATPETATRLASDPGSPAAFRYVLASSVLPRLGPSDASGLLQSFDSVFSGDSVDRNRNTSEIWNLLSIASSLGEYGRAWCSKVIGAAPSAERRSQELQALNLRIESIKSGVSPR